MTPNKKSYRKHTYLKIGQCAELSQWKPLFFCPVRTSQIMIACGSSLVSMRGLNVTTYLRKKKNMTFQIQVTIKPLPLNKWTHSYRCRTSHRERNQWVEPLDDWTSGSAWTSHPPTERCLSDGRWPSRCLSETTAHTSQSSAGTNARQKPLNTLQADPPGTFSYWKAKRVNTASTHRSFLHLNGLLDIISKYARSFTRVIDDAVLIPTFGIFHPVPQISLRQTHN